MHRGESETRGPTPDPRLQDMLDVLARDPPPVIADRDPQAPEADIRPEDDPEWPIRLSVLDRVLDQGLHEKRWEKDGSRGRRDAPLDLESGPEARLLQREVRVDVAEFVVERGERRRASKRGAAVVRKGQHEFAGYIGLRAGEGGDGVERVEEEVRFDLRLQRGELGRCAGLGMDLDLAGGEGHRQEAREDLDHGAIAIGDLERALAEHDQRTDHATPDAQGADDGGSQRAFPGAPVPPAHGQPGDARLRHRLDRAGRGGRTGAVMVTRQTHVREDVLAIRHRDGGETEAALYLLRDRERAARGEALPECRTRDRRDLEDGRRLIVSERPGAGERAAHQAEPEREDEGADRDDRDDCDGADVEPGERLEREPRDAGLEKPQRRGGHQGPAEVRPAPATGPSRRAAPTRLPRERGVASSLVGGGRLHRSLIVPGVRSGSRTHTLARGMIRGWNSRMATASSTYPRRRPRRRRRRTGPRIAALVALVALGLAVIFALHGLTFRGEIAPGISVGGVDVGGLPPQEAEIKLANAFDPRLERPVEVTVGRRSATVVPTEAEVAFDAGATVEEAMRTGRLASMVRPFLYARDIEPVLAAPENPPIPAPLRLAEREPESARVRVVDGETQVIPARAGRTLNSRGVALAAARAALAGQSAITLETARQAPEITTAEARAAADRATRAFGAPVALTVDGRRVGAVPTAALADAITVRDEEGEPVIALRPKVLVPVIDEILGDRIRAPKNAVCDTDGQRAWVVPAVNGVGYQPRAAADAIRDAALEDGSRVAAIDLGAILPRRSTEEAEGYGIATRVAGGVTNLGDSSADRIHNVSLMADILDLRLVMPGETFSFNEAVGPRTPERGFREGLAISGGFLLPSIGGGICQVSTTLFQAAYTMGLPIVERNNHSFYIDKYGLGLDATVSWGGPDFRFANDTEHPILIRATADGSSMIVNLYSAPRDGYEVETRTSEPREIIEPEKRYILDPLVTPGQIIQQTSGTEGFSVDVTRIIRKDGDVLREETFASTYDMEPQLFIVGPETELPEGADPDAVIEAPPEGWVSPFAAR